MQQIHRSLRFLTSAFPHGAYQSGEQNRPELRAPSVKGQLRWWFGALFNDEQEENRLFGGIQKELTSSRVVVRVSELSPVRTTPSAFMPHKGHQGGRKNAIVAGTSFDIRLIVRRGEVSPEQFNKLEKTMDAWLLFGSVGQRANRAAGSVWPENAPQNKEAYQTLANQLLGRTKLRCAVLEEHFSGDEAKLRDVAGDFLADQAFDGCDRPFGSAKPRKPSLLRLKAASFEGKLHLVALWDGRFQQSAHNLRKGIRILADQRKEIGRRLSAVQESLCRNL
jgi:CRISPR type III-B/RAMP module RAMP protein Cmr1